MRYYGTKLFIAKSSDSASDLELPFRTQCGSPEWENGRCRIFRADARYTGKSYFRAYAEELLDEVFDMVHENVPIDFVNGLCGIGWGIEYLLCHSLMDGDADEVLEDIDKKIVERDPLYVRDLSLHTGVQGILMYVAARLSHVRTNDYRPFPSGYLERLQKRLAGISPSDPELTAAFKEMILLFDAGISGTDVGSIPWAITDEFYGTLPVDFKSITSYPIGIYQGLTGVAFKLILP